MERVADSYTFIIIFNNKNEYKNSLKAMNDLGIPEEFSEQIYNDIEKNKCDKKVIAKLIEEAIEDENWWKFYDYYDTSIYSDKIKGKLNKKNKNDIAQEIKKLPTCCYFSYVEYENDDFCYELLKQYIMPNLSFVYRVIANN